MNLVNEGVLPPNELDDRDERLELQELREIERPRNCDRLSADQCKKMFEHEMGIYFPKEATDRDREIARCTAYGVIDALYAERKGESDGSK